MNTDMKRFLATVSVLCIAIVFALWRYGEYAVNPWTRDGLIRAEIILIAPEQNGVITSVDAPPDSRTEKGQTLFTVATTSDQQGSPVPVKAPADGYFVGMTVGPGSQVQKDQPLAALIVKDSFYAEAFFRETVISSIRPGQRALVTLASYPDTPIIGVVQSVGYGIARSDGTPAPTAEDMLPQVSPTFEWIRIAQRVPVRIKLENIPPEITLRVGLSASVLVPLDDDRPLWERLADYLR